MYDSQNLSFWVARRIILGECIGRAFDEFHLVNIVIRFLDVDCHLIPNIRPNLERRPDLLIGMPVAREILRFAFETPSALFHENDNPGPNFISYEL